MDFRKRLKRLAVIEKFCPLESLSRWWNCRKVFTLPWKENFIPLLHSNCPFSIFFAGEFGLFLLWVEKLLVKGLCSASNFLHGKCRTSIMRVFRESKGLHNKRLNWHWNSKNLRSSEPPLYTSLFSIRGLKLTESLPHWRWEISFHLQWETRRMPWDTDSNLAVSAGIGTDGKFLGIFDNFCTGKGQFLVPSGELFWFSVGMEQRYLVS